MPRDLRIWLGGGFILLLLAIALLAPLIAPFDPLEQDLMAATAAPGQEPGRWLGTDSLGRDLLSRMIYATRIALTVAFVAATLACILGTALGLLAGYFGGWTDAVIAARVSRQFNDNWYGFAYADVGGFGIGDSSDLTWQAFAGAGYRFSETWSVAGGYRNLTIEREFGPLDVTSDVSGPFLGFQARF